MHCGRVRDRDPERLRVVTGERQLGGHLVDDGQDAVSPQGRGKGPPRGDTQARAGRIGMVGHQVRDGGCVLTRGAIGFDDDHVGIVDVDGHGYELGTGRCDRLERTGMTGMLVQHPPARADDGVQDGVQPQPSSRRSP